MGNIGSKPPTLRDVTREAVRARIAEAAVVLFDEHGYENVTVDQIASAVGMSARSFNRYFPTKEDTVLPDATAWGNAVRDALEARPGDEPLWASLENAYRSLLASGEPTGDREKRAMRVLISAAPLRARNLEKHLSWARTITPVVVERLPGEDAELRAELLVQASLTCFDFALSRWAQADENRSPGELLSLAFATIMPGAQE